MKTFSMSLLFFTVCFVAAGCSINDEKTVRIEPAKSTSNSPQDNADLDADLESLELLRELAEHWNPENLNLEN